MLLGCMFTITELHFFGLFWFVWVPHLAVNFPLIEHDKEKALKMKGVSVHH